MYYETIREKVPETEDTFPIWLFDILNIAKEADLESDTMKSEVAGLNAKIESLQSTIVELQEKLAAETVPEPVTELEDEKHIETVDEVLAEGLDF